LAATHTYSEFLLKYSGDRPRQPAYEIKLMLWRVSWELAQICCFPWLGIPLTGLCHKYIVLLSCSWLLMRGLFPACNSLKLRNGNWKMVRR